MDAWFEGVFYVLGVGLLLGVLLLLREALKQGSHFQGLLKKSWARIRSFFPVPTKSIPNSLSLQTLRPAAPHHSRSRTSLALSDLF